MTLLLALFSNNYFLLSITYTLSHTHAHKHILAAHCLIVSVVWELTGCRSIVSTVKNLEPATNQFIAR